MRNPTYKPSFTITELLVVLAVIGTLSAMALPYCWGAYRSAEAKSMASVVASILRNTRQLAQAKGKNYEINFSPADNKIQIEVYTDLFKENPLKSGKTEKISLSSSYEITTTFHNDKAVFTNFGTSNGGSVYITDVSSAKGYRITVLASSGRVRIIALE
jgi:type II secretory pathway pseudopilin PulG